MGDRFTCPHGFAQIPSDVTTNKVVELHKNWLVETQTLSAQFDLSLIYVEAGTCQSYFAHIARDQPEHKENYHRCSQQGRDDQQQAFGDISMHSRAKKEDRLPPYKRQAGASNQQITLTAIYISNHCSSHNFGYEHFPPVHQTLSRCWFR